MAKKNVTELNTSGCKPRSVKYSSTNSKYFKTISPVPIKPSSAETVRLSPAASPAGPKNNPSSSSPRTSPGLLAGHYAGCKFTEPPLPSALPLPPQHWMQQQGRPRVVSLLLRPKEILKTTTTVTLATATTTPQAAPANDFFLSQQLKMLLKVQA